MVLTLGCGTGKESECSGCETKIHIGGKRVEYENRFMAKKKVEELNRDKSITSVISGIPHSLYSSPQQLLYNSLILSLLEV